jgi:hypothetical protein
MRKQDVQVESIRAADHDIATGGWPDMCSHLLNQAGQYGAEGPGMAGPRP